MPVTSENPLQVLTAKAERLARWQFYHLAAALLENYDGEQAEQTRPARLAEAHRYEELARQRDQTRR